MDNKEIEDCIKAIIRMGVFLRAAQEIGLSTEEVKDMINYIAQKRKETKS